MTPGWVDEGGMGGGGCYLRLRVPTVPPGELPAAAAAAAAGLRPIQLLALPLTHTKSSQGAPSH